MLPARDRRLLIAVLAMALNTPDERRRWAALAWVARRMAAAEDRLPAGALH